MAFVPNRIEKKIHLQAPKASVWRAISDSTQFGKWFGAAFDAQFEEGRTVKGTIKPTQVDADVAKLQAPHAGEPIDLEIENVVPERLLAFRWHPTARTEPTTRVAFELDDDPAGTLLTISETGFDQLPEARREQAFKSNDGGWAHQVKLIEKYVAAH